MTRVSLGAQSFQPRLLEVLERRARPEDVRRAFAVLREAGFDNLSLDLIYGIPGQTAADLDADLSEALALGPEHVSAYELEAKPGTRFTHAHGEELARQAEAMESYFERVVARLTEAGFRWYETANFCRARRGRDLRSRHNLAYWRGRDYLGLGDRRGLDDRRPRAGGRRRGSGATSPRCRRASGRERELEELPPPVRRSERVLLGLRLDEPLVARRPGATRSTPSRRRRGSSGSGLVARGQARASLALTERGRFLGGGVTAELLA